MNVPSEEHSSFSFEMSTGWFITGSGTEVGVGLKVDVGAIGDGVLERILYVLVLHPVAKKIIRIIDTTDFALII